MSIKINFVRGDEILTTTMSVGRTMLDAAKRLKIPEIPAICNGSCNCGTCHVHIDERWLAKHGKISNTTPEIELLEYEKGYKDGISRLACQIVLDKDDDGLIVHLRNDELL